MRKLCATDPAAEFLLKDHHWESVCKQKASLSVYTEFLAQTPHVLSPTVYLEQWCLVSHMAFKHSQSAKATYNLLQHTIRCLKSHFKKKKF